MVPATFNLVGKLAAGIADDLLTTALAATDAPVVLFPSMNAGMYAQAVLRENLERLRAWSGRRRSRPRRPGLRGRGRGRLPRLERICAAIEAAAAAHPGPLAGRRVVVTAGPTHEAIDPVRFISSGSTGTMGHALAVEAARRGAQVVLVTGPTHLPAPRGVEVVRVTTAAEMRAVVLSAPPGPTPS